MTIQRGLTLIEVLVTMTVIGLLATLLFPSLQSARAAAQRTSCSNNLRQLGLAAHLYHGNHNEFPPGLDQLQAAWPPRYRGTSLFAHLLPYLEHGQLLEGWDYARPMNNTTGGRAAVSAARIPTYLCPTDAVRTNPVSVAGRYYGLTSYGGNGGSRSHHPSRATADGIFHTTGPAAEPDPQQRPVSLSMIGDGTSKTILFGERSHHDPHYESFARQYWADSLSYLGKWAAIGGRKRIGDVTMSAFAPINYRVPFAYVDRTSFDQPMESMLDFEIIEDRRKCAFGSNHVAGANFGLVDGSVRFLSESLSLPLLRAFCTRAGGELYHGEKNSTAR